MTKLFDWVDHRTGFRSFIKLMLLERIPGGAKWRYIWGSVLAFVFIIQLVTGVLLMTSYSPSATNAWGSVHYIQYQMDFGWLIRGLHHFGSQTMVVLIALHMLQVVIAGAQLPPREFNWWTGLILLGIVLGLSLTGYLLPWDQKGYYATQVATNIAGGIPVIGSQVQAFLLGGDSYGNHTLTRFFSLHVWVLPFSLILVFVIHIVFFRRHGVTAPGNEEGWVGAGHGEGEEQPLPPGDAWFWPDQVFRDLVAMLVVFAVLVSLVIFSGHGHKIESAPQDLEASSYDYWAKAGTRGWGANLDAPADRNAEGYPARPEWYFLFLFQLLKYFEGPKILIGTLIIPAAVKGLLFMLPLFGYGRMRGFGRFIGIVVVVGLLGAVAALTGLAMIDDAPGPWPGKVGPLNLNWGGGSDKGKDFTHRREVADQEAYRACNIAYFGIPVDGDVTLTRNDPLLQGPKLFAKNCAVCHQYTPTELELKRNPLLEPLVKTPDGKPGPLQAKDAKAPDLGGYGSKEWVKKVLTDPKAVFGKSKQDGMIRWREKVDKKRLKMEKDEVAKQDQEFDTISAWLADQKNPEKLRDKDLDSKGRSLFMDSCSGCHTVKGEGGGTAPDFTNYASGEWIRLMVMAPDHASRFGEKNEMPAFRDFDGQNGEFAREEYKKLYEKDDHKVTTNALSDLNREIIVRWLAGDDRVVFGGAPLSGVQKKEDK